MTRRELVALLVGAAVLWPRPTRAQQPAIPVIGFLDSTSPASLGPFIEDFRKGLAEVGFVEGRNMRIEYRWADGQYARLPGLAAELVRIPVSVLAATGVTAALAAKGSTTTIPIVFHTGGDPVKIGLVASLAKPGGNVTGVVSLNKILVPKQLEMLRELVPKADVIGFLVNPNNGVIRLDMSNMREAAHAKGVQLQIAEARNAIAHRANGLLLAEVHVIVSRVHGKANMLEQSAITEKVAFPVRHHENQRPNIKRLPFVRMQSKRHAPKLPLDTPPPRSYRGSLPLSCEQAKILRDLGIQQ